jgi:hypothetical protein
MSEKPKTVIGDETHAEALRIAERHLVKQGWKFTPAQVGETASVIISALTAGGTSHE